MELPFLNHFRSFIFAERVRCIIFTIEVVYSIIIYYYLLFYYYCHYYFIIIGNMMELKEK